MTRVKKKKEKKEKKEREIIVYMVEIKSVSCFI
jgi:hypothetical protein